MARHEFTAPKRSVAHALPPPKVAPRRAAPIDGQHTRRLGRGARLDTVRAHHFRDLACQPSAGSPSGRRMAHLLTTSATALSRPRCATWCSNTPGPTPPRPKTLPARTCRRSSRLSPGEFDAFPECGFLFAEPIAAGWRPAVTRNRRPRRKNFGGATKAQQSCATFRDRRGGVKARVPGAMGEEQMRLKFLSSTQAQAASAGRGQVSAKSGQDWARFMEGTSALQRRPAGAWAWTGRLGRGLRGWQAKPRTSPRKAMLSPSDGLTQRIASRRSCGGRTLTLVDATAPLTP